MDGAFAVITRAAEKKQREEAEMHHRKERVCGVQLMQLILPQVGVKLPVVG